MSELLDQAPPVRAPRQGEVVEASVISVELEGVLVSVGMKTEGIVPPEEMRTLSNEERARLQTGDKLYVMMVAAEGQSGMALLSVDRAEEERKWSEMARHHKDKAPLTARIAGFNKGGFVVEYQGIQGFMPFSHAVPLPRGASQQEEMQRRVGQEAQVNVVEVDRSRGRLVFSEREIWQRRRDEARDRAYAELVEGTILKGRVSSIQAYGAFVNLGEIDGLLPISELAWSRVKSVQSVLKVGQEIDVYVLEVDRDKRRVALSLKRTVPEPWETVEERYAPGQVTQGMVSRLTDFGAFVQLEEAIDGLVHISELSWKNVKTADEVLKVGDVIKVQVLQVDKANRRISLSYRRTQPHPWDTVPERYKVGEVAKGVVTRITPFGVFVQLEETVEGLIPIQELSARQAVDPAECVYIRQKVPVKVLAIDVKGRRMTLSYKQAFGIVDAPRKPRRGEKTDAE
jgi:small subunit ribosomal protein S1